MKNRKIHPVQLYKLAEDLGLKPKDDPVAAILDYCERRIGELMADYAECHTLTQMLDWVANRVGTSFEEVKTDDDLREVQQRYLKEKELGFVQLEEDLSAEVFGQTIKLNNREPWEKQYVSVIDCRGDKAARSYFTKWHEIAHLLTLTSQMRLVFRRTHRAVSGLDPEERLMDEIAGRFGFYPSLFHHHINGEISFEHIEALRLKLCPEASLQASQINIVKYWPTPCIYLRAEMGYRKDEEAKLAQQSFYFLDPPEASLRAIHVAPNEKAREKNLFIHENMRVPERSVISRLFAGESLCDEAEEDLNWWETSGGNRLMDCPIRVNVRRYLQSVEALISPI
ncbi:MAG: hypothetical protein AB7U82_05580 [Blastocatellales bacterium]|jgi:hypothetical protein|nr:hypothetical protein [Nitrosomonas nitrosa]